MARPKAPEASVQFRFRIRESIGQRLEEAAAARGISANQEIAERLASSFEPKRRRLEDPTTNAIVDLVAEVISSAGRVAGSWSPTTPWYDQPFAFDQVREAVLVALRSIAPAGDPKDLPAVFSRNSDRTVLMTTGELAARSIIALIELCDERDDPLERPPPARPESLTKNERDLGTQLRSALGHIAERIQQPEALEKISEQARDK
jgi:hypothetical protein